MASFARKWLEGILENEELSAKEKAQQIMDGHIAVTDGLKEERDSYKADADKAADLQKQLEDLTASGEDFKKKFESEHKAFEDFKKQESVKNGWIRSSRSPICPSSSWTRTAIWKGSMS